jgi:IS1 family transposase
MEKRIQFEFSASMMMRLDKLKAATESTTYAEVIRDSLRVYEWFLRDRDCLARVYPDGTAIPLEVALL